VRVLARGRPTRPAQRCFPLNLRSIRTKASSYGRAVPLPSINESRSSRSRSVSVRLSRSFQLGRRVSPSSHHGERRATGKSKSQRTCARFRSAPRIPATVYHREESVSAWCSARRCHASVVPCPFRTRFANADERCALSMLESLCSRWVSTRSRDSEESTKDVKVGDLARVEPTE